MLQRLNVINKRSSIVPICAKLTFLQPPKMFEMFNAVFTAVKLHCHCSFSIILPQNNPLLPHNYYSFIAVSMQSLQICAVDGCTIIISTKYNERESSVNKYMQHLFLQYHRIGLISFWNNYLEQDVALTPRHASLPAFCWWRCWLSCLYQRSTISVKEKKWKICVRNNETFVENFNGLSLHSSPVRKVKMRQKGFEYPLLLSSTLSTSYCHD